MDLIKDIKIALNNRATFIKFKLIVKYLRYSALGTFLIHGWKETARQLSSLIHSPANRYDYHNWVATYDSASHTRSKKIGRRIRSLPYKPRISVLLHISDQHINYLDETILSVRSQPYSNLELCIAYDEILKPVISSILQQHASIDERINVISYKTNTPKSIALNLILEKVTGEYITFVEQNDKLAEYGLFWLIDSINKHQDAKLLYSDEDEINHNNQRQNPYFKCDWNYDLFLSQNLISHLAVYQTDLVKGVGGFRIGFEGAENYDLALRCLDKISQAKIVHISRILYHKREQAKDTGPVVQSKPYASPAGEKSINDYLKRNKILGQAQFVGHGYRVRYEIQQPYPKVTLVIPTRNGYQFIRKCIESIFEKTTYQNYTIIIVDNGSDDSQTLEYLNILKKDYRISILRDDGPFNYAALNNKAVKIASGSIVGLLNNDVSVITKDWMEEMVSHAMRPGIGAVGARLWYPNDTLQHAGMIVGIGGNVSYSHDRLVKEDLGYFGRASLIQSFSALIGACLFVRKELYQAVDGLDEHNMPVDFNDVDFCLKLYKLGYRNIWTPYAQLYHHLSATRIPPGHKGNWKLYRKSHAHFIKKWKKIIADDPSYSRNLTLDNENYAYAWPPRVKNT